MRGQDDFVLGKKLGEGAFGVVYKASLANPEAAKKVKANVVSAYKRFNFLEFRLPICTFSPA
jgi:serine/threonine protein kinase